MRILVTGGTGTVGSQVVRELTAKGHDVRVLTRTVDRAKALPDGASAVAGSLQDEASLPAAMDGAEAVFLLTPLAEDETRQGLAGVAAARAAGVRRIVYMTVHKLDGGRHIPHFASKLPVVEAIRSSGLEYTLIEPNNFHQNDFWVKDAIVKYGVYPWPIGDVGLSRVDVRDIAEAAAKTLTDEGHNGEAYPLVGPDVLTGEDCARIWSKHLGRQVRYQGDLAAWREQAAQMMPEWMVHDLAIMLEHFIEKGLAAEDGEVRKLTGLLGHPPRSFDAFAAETALMWNDEAVAD